MKVVKINIGGTIVSDEDAWIYEWFGLTNTSPKKIREELSKAEGDEVVFEINSGGGDLIAGNEIYYVIHDYTGRTVSDIVGIAASAATVIACGADVVRASPGMQYMIHNVSSTTSGDYRAMDHMSDILKNANKAVSNIYRLKTGMSEKDLLKLMNEETWMEATRARELGFVDEIIGDTGALKKSKVAVYNSAVTLLPEEVKDKIRNMVGNPGNDSMEKMKKQKQLELLKLKGEIRYV
jgi:ATP-dependent Clp protease protease subunit